MQIDWVLIWDFISENSSFWEIWGKMLDRKPKQVSEKEWKSVTFELISDQNLLLGLCEIIAFDLIRDLKKKLFWWKRAKNDAKTVIFWVFFVRFCPQVANSSFSLFFYSLSQTLSPLYAKNHVFSHVFRVFSCILGDLAGFSTLFWRWRGDYRGRLSLKPIYFRKSAVKSM